MQLRRKRDRMVLEASRAGYTLTEIISMVHVDGLPDLKTRSAAHKIIMRHLDGYLQEPTDKLRRAMLDRLEAVVQKLFPLAIQGIRVTPAYVKTVPAKNGVPEHQKTIPARQVPISLDEQMAAQDRLLRVYGDIRRLTGLDKPIRTELTGADGAPLGSAMTLEELIARSKGSNECDPEDEGTSGETNDEPGRGSSSTPSGASPTSASS